MLRFTFAALILATAFTGTAAANASADTGACKAMQAALVPRQEELAELTKQRDASAVLVEESGLAWEDVEIHRLVSARHAADADREKAVYEAARQKLARDEMALQSTLKQYNTDVAVFNGRCAAKK